ncbi:MAG TPA: alpha-xylosidase [Anaerolineae bacterium]
MKFTAGYWEMRPGITPYFATQLHEVKVEHSTLTAFAATHKITSRGDTLNSPMLTVQLSSPMENVVRVQLSNYRGLQSRKPSFDLKEAPSPETHTFEDESSATLASGQLSVRVAKGADWHIDFCDGKRILTSSGWRAMSVMDTSDGHYMTEQLSLGVGELVYGLGERFTSFVKNGQVIDMWNDDGGTASELAYKNIPFYMTNRGYGVFVNHPERVSFEVASEKVERVQFSVPGEALDYFLIYGPSPAAILERYTALTGRPALSPAWSFGLWLTTSFTTSYDEETVTGFIQGMADRDLPLHVFHFDCFWMKEFHWCNFEWDERCFPDPPAMLARLKARGLRICVWINPYIAQRSAMFDEGMANGFLLKRASGDVFQWDRWQAGMALVDFTNPAACKWYGDKLRSLVDMGVDCFKTDFGERVPTDVIYHDGSDPQRMHNFYSYLYNQTVFKVLEEKLGKGEAAVFARSATSGGQQYPVHWGGDSTATFESMAESLRGGLSLGQSGFGFWSHDMGGFEQTASADVYKRWCAFGLLSSHSRLHGANSYRVPWLFDEEAVDVLRHWTKLKCRLMPYLFGAALQAHETGLPVLRAMPLVFPDDPACDTLDRQYMLGDSLLVAPVFTPDGTVQYYLPDGRWTHFLSGNIVTGGRWLRENHDFFSLPLMVRPNSIVAIGSNEQKPDYDFADGVVLHVFELTDALPATVSVPDTNGRTALQAMVLRQGQTITVKALWHRENWKVLLRNIFSVESVEGGSGETSPSGFLVTPAADLVVIQLTNQVDHQPHR